MNVMPLPFVFVSAPLLETWDWTTPEVTGIGGSETHQIQMAQRLAKRGYAVTSYGPTPFDGPQEGPAGEVWRSVTKFSPNQPAIYVVCRAPEYIDQIPEGSPIWFVAQDVDYYEAWTDARLARVTRFITLCASHAAYTEQRYPSISTRLYQSSNGISIPVDRVATVERVPRQMLYASSPDRGLKLLLEQWWRIREMFPDASLKVAYGFENMEIIAKKMAGASWHAGYQKQVETLLKQPGVTTLGRLPQSKLAEEWERASVWAHPTDFPETSCITCMEAQALGAVPVTNRLWAIKSNVSEEFGRMVDGIPQKSPIVLHRWLQELYSELSNPLPDDRREAMMRWARERYNWENIVDQWDFWAAEDSDKCQK
jgi:glycosyltransferase involved in cell wall biosynthesis